MTESSTWSLKTRAAVRKCLSRGEKCHTLEMISSSWILLPTTANVVFPEGLSGQRVGSVTQRQLERVVACIFVVGVVIQPKCFKSRSAVSASITGVATWNVKNALRRFRLVGATKTELRETTVINATTEHLVRVDQSTMNSLVPTTEELTRQFVKWLGKSQETVQSLQL